LSNKGVEISRRTVAKYREAIGIPSTKIRKRR
jgi:DNA-directed RNA polymerase specialized sigma54-like protein